MELNRILIRSSQNYRNERAYIISVLLGDILGLHWELVPDDRENIHMSIPHVPGEIILPDTFFQTPSIDWLTPDSLPHHPLSFWDVEASDLGSVLVDPRLPVIYGDARLTWSVSSDRIRLPIDIFGSSFFMLTRYEETVLPYRDIYDRFPATNSLAFKAGFLNRPIVDEYAEILWAAMKRLWPFLQRKFSQFVVKLSHDVDHVRRFGNLCQDGRTLAGDILKRRSISKATNTFFAMLGSYLDHRRDPYVKGLHYLVDLSEKHGFKSAFYLMAADKDTYDSGYDVNSRQLRRWIEDSRQKGHEMGFHPSYKSVVQPLVFKKEKERMDSMLGQKKYGGRHHCLRFRIPETWRQWEEAGLDYDSTLSYAEHEGFRCGTCHPYQPFDVVQKRRLHLLEIPLIVMDTTLRVYRNLSPEEGEEKIITLAERCKKVGGTFTLLWHNSSFDEEWAEWAAMYTRLLPRLATML